MTANDKEVIHQRIKKYSEKLDSTIEKLNKIDKEVALMKQNVDGLEKEMGFHVGEIKESIKANLAEVRGMFGKIITNEKTREDDTAETKKYYTRLVVGGLIVLTVGFLFGKLTKGF